ncbi:MAG: amidohydrolase [Spirochaetales bacterium]|nr:amidohydrolase [Spirochaetales bacterium]
MILLKDISYLIRDSQRVEENIDLLTDGAVIKKIGRISKKDIPENISVIDCRNKVVIPGLINAHTHLWQMLLKGRRDDLSLMPWIEEVLSPLIISMSKKKNSSEIKELSYLWSMLGSIEMIRGGITSFINMDLGFSGLEMVRAWNDIGIRASFGVEMADMWNPGDTPKNMDKEKEDVLELIEGCHNTPFESPLTKIILAPSAPFICSENLLGWTAETAKKNNLALQIHVSETVQEVDDSIHKNGKPPLEYLDSLGFLSQPVSAVHCVHLTENEIEIAKKRHVIPVYNPKSNMKLGSGIAPVRKMLDGGLKIALGTDGPASNDIMDMFEEMRTGSLLQRAAEKNPSVISSAEIFGMATETGAVSSGIDAGILEESKLADLVILDKSSAHAFSLETNILSWLVFCAKSSDVESVIINGNFVMKNRNIIGIDERHIMSEINKIARKF